MTKLVFNQALDFEYAAVAQLSPLVQRVVANNPSPFTFLGTGTYIIGTTDVAVIDPGPDNDEHVEAINHALEGRNLTHLVITHTHLDHSPAAAALKASHGAPTYGFGPHGAGQKPSSVEGEPVEEGADTAFVPDHPLEDGALLRGPDWTLEAVYTPGHTSNHLCYALKEENVLFSGDHVMGWSTTVVSPPDGDMAHYMASLQKLVERPEHTYWPTHGDAIEDPATFVPGLVTHRERREEQVLRALNQGLNTIPEMVTQMYQDVPSYLHPAAARSVLAHLIWLVEKGQVATDGAPGVLSHYRTT